MTRRETVWSLLAAVALVALVFHGVVFGGKTLATTPLIQSVFAAGVWHEGADFDTLNCPGFLPQETVIDPVCSASGDEAFPYAHRRIWASGALPWLNPFQGMGHPLAANLWCAAFYPLEMLPVLLASPAAWDAFVLLRVLLFGWFLYLYLRKLGIGIAASCLGGAVCAFGGYTMAWLNVLQMNVDLLIPLLLLLVESWVRTRTRLLFAAISVATAAAFLGGNPQPLLLGLVLVSAYAAVRLCEASASVRVLGAIAMLFAALGVGIALVGFLLVPFLEFYTQTFHSHPVGTSDLCVPRSNFIFSVFPALHTNMLADLLSRMDGGNSHYPLFGPGLAAFPLVLFSVGMRRKWPVPTLFFWAVWLLMSVQLAGFLGSAASWVPLLSRVTIPKYQAVNVIAHSVLAAMGAEYVAGVARSGSLGKRAFLGLAMVCLLALPFVYLASWYEPHVSILRLSPFREHVRHVLGLYAALGIGASLLVILALLGPIRVRGVAGIVLLLPIVAESLINTARPYAPRTDTYAAPPFVRFLQAKASGNAGQADWRLYAVGSALTPNIASVFGIEDLRLLDSLTWQPLRDFAVDVLFGGRPTGLHNWFIGSTDKAVVHSPLMNVCNVRYLAADASPLAAQTTREFASRGELRSQLGGRLQCRDTIEGSVMRAGIELPAPGIWTLPVAVRGSDEELRFFLSAPNDMLSCRVEVHVQTSDSAALLWTKEFDPARQLNDRRWYAARIPLGRFADTTVTLMFQATSPRPGSAVRLADFSLRSADLADLRYRLVHDQEILLYENLQVCERAFLASHARIVGCWSQMRQAVVADPDRVASSPLFLDSPETRRVLAALLPVQPGDAPTSASAPGAVTVQERSVYRQVYAVSVAQPALLVQSCLAYPGWRVRVDGKDAVLARAYGCLQAVALPAGNHTVMFEYAPRSVTTGWALTCMAAVALLCIVAPAVRRRRLTVGNTTGITTDMDQTGSVR